jgi:hypothetical protein
MALPLSFEIEYQGINYLVEVYEHTVYIEYVDIDEDVEEEMLLKITEYLIEEGFVQYDKE